MSKVHQLKRVQFIPATIDIVWNFFSAPENLKNITPQHLGFQILSKKHGDVLYAGS
jgi:ligand-binding SRPBCC domain-containing protein